MSTITIDDRTIPARDRHPLGATLFRSPRPAGRLVIVNGATGVPQGYYRRFAAHLAEAGLDVVTYDYRGIGRSKPPSLRGFEATMRDWALRDMAGVLDWAADTFGANQRFLVGHSFGGQLAGLLDDVDHIDGMVTFASQSGYWRLMGGEQQLVVGVHAHITLPLLARLVGYAPLSRLGAGEDLPAGVAREWAAWLRQPRYVLDDDSLPLERFAEFAAPVLAYAAVDDKWGTPRAVDAMMAAYPDVERRDLHPADHGVAAIGHMGFFRPELSSLWDETIAWFETR